MGSYLYLLFLLSPFHILTSSSSDHLCLHDQSSALLQFKHSFSLNKSVSFYPISHPKVESWKPDTDCCFWDGVTCDIASGDVIGLELSNSWLYGSIDSNSTLFHLRRLRTLNLAYNHFNFSRIPSGFHRLTSLTHLNLSYSMFSGQIPFEISGMTQLVSLDLSLCYDLKLEKPSLGTLVQRLTNLQELHLDRVYISSVVPDFLANLSSLTSLHLRSCNLRGELQKSIFLLPNLQSLSVGNNPGLSGYLPEFHSNSSLKFLDLSYTSFSGSFPSSILNLTQLVWLDLSQNKLTGQIPSSIANLTNLKYLGLYSNQLTGPIPSCLGYLSNLTTLDLAANSLSGAIPSSLFTLPSLKSLYLDQNKLNGQIPSSISNLTQLIQLFLSNNKLTGQIPSSLASLTNLKYLSLYSNQLTGPIPSCLGYLSNLTTLILTNNSLSGAIPSSLFTLPSLLELDLDQNKLNGQIPSSISNLTQLVQLYLSRNKLTGQIPSSLASLTNLQYLTLYSNQLTGPIPSCLSYLSNLTTLDLGANSLSGAIPSSLFTLPSLQELYLSGNKLSLITNISEFPEFLRNQTELTKLDLSNNKIHGQIPKWMWKVGKETLYYMNLSHNFLQGFDQPPSILPWSRLSTLDLHSNELQGPLPSLPISTSFFSIANNKLTGEIPSLICNASSLEVLDLSNNSLGGEIPPLICNASSLSILDLSNNNLSGEIPRCLGNFSNSIYVLKLRRNRFHGTIPQTFTQGSSLSTLDLNGNQLEGRVPRSLVNCKTLEVLDLGNNQLNDTFPFWLETLPELQVLDLRSNKFHGLIRHPRTDQAFSKLRIIDLSYNEFTGNLPSTYFLRWSSMMMIHENNSQLKYMKDDISYYHDSVIVMNKGLEMVMVKILTIFTAIDLSNNRFQGQIPESIGNLKALHVLNLSSNSLTGRIPSSLGNLKELESLDLSQNKLSGEIPQQLTSLSFLEVLNLSRNHLMGPIPRGQQFETFANTSFDMNSGLCGFPLLKKCRDVGASKPPPSAFQRGQDLEATSEGFDLKVILMGYGCGVVIGVVIGYITFWRQNGWLTRVTDATLSKRNGKRSKMRGDTRRRR